MENNYTISIHLDTRRAKSNGKYPVKLRVYTSTSRKRKYYGTKFDFTEQEFKSIWLSEKPRKDHKEVRRQLFAIETKAEKVARNLNPFAFEQFEKQLYRKAGEGITIKYHYENTVRDLRKNEQIGTASSYELAEKSIIKFLDDKFSLSYKALTFHDITPQWLNNYENFMIKERNLSSTTVSIYLRTLRAIFNKAIDDKEIEKDHYPFGKRKYQLPNSKNVKKALTKNDIKAFYNSKAHTDQQQKAKDFWLFTYSSNGLNIKDIALFKYKDVQNDKIEFYRAKTRNTSKTNLKPITIYLNDFTKSIIEKYGNKNKAHDQLIFDIISDKMTPEQRHKAIKNFARFMKQHIKKLCEKNGLPENITQIWARHSFASNYVLQGASIVDIMESMGHNSIQTTQNYLRSFDSDVKKKQLNSLLDFN